MLFREMERTFMGPKPYAEPDYEYLDRSDRPAAMCIRNTMEEWLTRYPESDRTDLVARFQSPDNVQHCGAAFELYLHELLLKLGYELTIHPDTPSSKDTSPDFLVMYKSEGAFYLEAVQSIEESDEDRAASARINVVYDTINRLASHNFYVAVDYEDVPAEAPSGRKLRANLGRWLESLDADAILEEVDARGYEALPTLTHEDEQWEVTFTAIPRASEKRDTRAGAIIGALGVQARWLNTWQKIRDSLLAKARRYGELDLPLIIAVNVIGFHLDRIDAMQALFGQEQYVVQWGNPTTEPRMERAPNGFWYGSQGSRYKRVGGVLLGYDLKPWTFGVRDLTLYINPWSDSIVLGDLTALPTAFASNERMEWKDGLHPTEILQLPQGYPGRGGA